MFRFFRHVNLVMALNKIIDEMNKENELIKKQLIDFRSRAFKAETENERLSKLLRDLRIKPVPPYEALESFLN